MVILRQAGTGRYDKASFEWSRTWMCFDLEGSTGVTW